MSAPLRILLGFAAAVISVLTFHQGMLLLLRELSLFGIPPTALVWNTTANANAYGLPNLVNLCFWGGLYGAVFGLLAPRFDVPLWLAGLLTGVVAALVGFFVVAAIKGSPIGGGWQMMAWVRSLAINGSFGLGLGLIYPILTAALAPVPLPRH